MDTHSPADPDAPGSADQGLPRAAVSVRQLTKIYRAADKTPEKHALKAIDLDIPRGSLFGLLGPNGAGKSTLINMLAGLVTKTAGTATVWGHDIDREPRQARAAIGVVPQELNIDPFFTPRELLELQAGLYGVPKRERLTDRLLAMVGLTDKAGAYARSLSGGMRRRLMVAKAMVHSPPVLVLDEPTAGVDVELRQQLWDQVRALNAAGTTVLLTTHYLEEAEALCDSIAIINHGRVIVSEPTQSLLGRVDQKCLTVQLARPLDALPPALDDLGATLEAPDRLRLRYRPSERALGRVLALLQEARLEVADLSTHETDLEQVFLQLTRRPDDDAG